MHSQAQRGITVERNDPERLLHVRRDGSEIVVLGYEEAKQLAADILREVYLRRDPDFASLPGGHRLSVILDGLADLVGRIDDEGEEEEAEWIADVCRRLDEAGVNWRNLAEAMPEVDVRASAATGAETVLMLRTGAAIQLQPDGRWVQVESWDSDITLGPVDAARLDDPEAWR